MIARVTVAHDKRHCTVQKSSSVVKTLLKLYIDFFYVVGIHSGLGRPYPHSVCGGGMGG